jgi:hypothetical protein
LSNLGVERKKKLNVHDLNARMMRENESAVNFKEPLIPLLGALLLVSMESNGIARL